MKQYIDKTAIAAEIKRCINDEIEIIKKYTHPFYATEITRCNARIVLLKQLQDFLDALEVKEVDSNDAFIEKAWDWIEDNLLSSNQQDKSCLYFEQFKNYIKE